MDPDPEALAVGAFFLDSGSYNFFAFTSSSILGRTVQKIQDNQAEGVLVIPNGPTQPWFPNVMRL